MTTLNDNEPVLAGDPDAQQSDPGFDINQDTIDPTDVVAMAQAIQAGVPIQAAAEAHEASLATHTWTPGVACPMRSHNRKVGALTSIYDLKHDDNQIVPAPGVGDVNWLARCETHEADFYSKTFAPAWRARNRPWEFCGECNTIFVQRYGKGALNKKALKRGTKVKTVAVAKPKPKPQADLNEAPASVAANEALADLVLDVEPQPAAAEADPEEAVWNEWSARLSKETPKGGVIDWLGEYHYAVNLADGRTIECRIHKGDAVFAHTSAKGKKHYTDTLPAMLAEIG